MYLIDMCKTWHSPETTADYFSKHYKNEIICWATGKRKHIPNKWNHTGCICCVQCNNNKNEQKWTSHTHINLSTWKFFSHLEIFKCFSKFLGLKRSQNYLGINDKKSYPKKILWLKQYWGSFRVLICISLRR